jgi:geranylgeranyl diphosphate synthase, type II
MNQLKNFFADAGEKVEKQLDMLVPSGEIEPKRLHSAMRWSLFGGGKRFRPALVIAVGKAFNVPEEKLLRCAAAIEMIHTYSLIHDDLPAMDDDKLRRGRETCHIKFDEATAILAGDCLQNLAFQTIAEDETLSEKLRIKLISEVANASGTPFGMVAGQQLDLEAEGKTIEIKELERIHHSKTGAMIASSARIGAIIGDASEIELKAVTQYAIQLGLLFQITDDLLDVTQTTEVLGKTAGKDVTAEKATYPSIYGLEEAQNLALKVHAKAIADLHKINKQTEILVELADFILHRKM